MGIIQYQAIVSVTPTISVTHVGYINSSLPFPQHCSTIERQARQMAEFDAASARAEARQLRAEMDFMREQGAITRAEAKRRAAVKTSVRKFAFA